MKCRCCKSINITELISLGNQHLSDFRDDDEKPPKYPLDLIFCNDCCFVQLKESVPYSIAHNIAVHMLALAILMGCTPIYLQGIEIPLELSKYTYRSNKEADELAITSNQSRNKLYWLDIARQIINDVSNYGTWPRIIRKLLKKTILPNLQLKIEDIKSVYYDNINSIFADFSYLINLARKRGIKVYNLSQTSSLNRLKEITYLDWKIVTDKHIRNFK